MPTRSKNHQLEDQSLRRFEDILPDAWVVRPLDKDYGHDREVEIFDNDGSHTGLTFRAQLKATQKAEGAFTYSIDTEHLDYFDSFDVPTAIVRYVAETESFYLCWHFNVGQHEKRKAQKTVTVRWDAEDSIDENLIASIRRTLDILRRVRSAYSPRHISVVASSAPSLAAELQHQFRRALDRVLEMQSDIHSGHDDIDSVPFEISFDGETVVVSLDCLSSISFYWDGETVVPEAAIIYAIGEILGHLGASDAVAALAETCLEHHLKAPAENIAARMSCALLSRPREAVELAILNDLHKPGVGQMFFSSALIGSAKSPRYTESVLEYFDACAHEASDDPGRAAAAYSKANYLLAQGEIASAFKLLNRARHLRPEYFKSSYFLHSLGTCLHLGRRFKLASRIYHSVVQSEPSAHNLYCYADSLMFSGEFALAENTFDRAMDIHNDEPPRAPFRELWDLPLRYELSRWLHQTHGSKVTRKPSELEQSRDDSSTKANWTAQLVLDPLDPLASFNLGVELSATQPSHAAMAFLVPALVNVEDEESWTNVILLLFNLGSTEMLGYSIAKMLRNCGVSGHDFLRAKLAEQGMPRDLVEQFSSAISLQMEHARRRNPIAQEAVILSEEEVFDNDGVVHVEIVDQP